MCRRKQFLLSKKKFFAIRLGSATVDRSAFEEEINVFRTFFVLYSCILFHDAAEEVFYSFPIPNLAKVEGRGFDEYRIGSENIIFFPRTTLIYLLLRKQYG